MVEMMGVKLAVERVDDLVSTWVAQLEKLKVESWGCTTASWMVAKLE